MRGTNGVAFGLRTELNVEGLGLLSAVAPSFTAAAPSFAAVAPSFLAVAPSFAAVAPWGVAPLSACRATSSERFV